MNKSFLVNDRSLMRRFVSLLRVLARPHVGAACVVAATATLWSPDAQAQILFRETFGSANAQLPTATSTADGNWTSAFCANGQILAGGSPSDAPGSTHFLLHFTQGADIGFPTCTYAPGEAVWRTVTPIPVQPNTTYVFSYWSSQRTDPSPAVLTQVVTPDAGAITVNNTTTPAWGSLNNWVQRTVTFTTGLTTTAVDLRIHNANTAGGGNDFGIDDISLTALPPPSCNIATNGSFESPNIQGDPNNPEPGTVYVNGWAAFRASQAALDGWQVVGGAVDILRYGVNASQGAQSIDLYGSAPPPTFQRTFTGLIPGQTYTFTVDYSGMETQASSSTVSLDQGGAGFQQITTLRPVAAAVANGNAGLPNTPQFTVTWATFTHSFVATAAEATIMFNQTTPSPDGAGLFIDNFVFASQASCHDFGDAPDSYGTLDATNGPRHAAVGYNAAAQTPLMLGDNVGIEINGQPDAGASLDLYDDGLVTSSVTLQSGATAASADLRAVNATATPATLAGWIDFNGNGTFEPTERAQITVPANTTTPTAFTLSWTGLPPISLATATTTIARFRVATNAAEVSAPTGMAADGEVEDYVLAVTLLPLNCGSGITQPIEGAAQAWTTDSTWQAAAGNEPVLALNAPDNQGVQLFSAQASSLELDLATVVPAGQSITLFLAKLASAAYAGPVLIQSSLDGTTWGAGVTTTPTATLPTYAPFVYSAPATGARYIRIVPQSNGGAGTALRVDAVTYSFQYCECAGGTNLVQQPSFEEFTSCSTQAAPFGNWSPIQNNIHIWGPTCGVNGWPVPHGVNSIDLDGSTTGGIQQTLTGLNPGQTYNLTFYMSFNPAAGAAAASMRVQVGNFNQIYTSASNAQVGGFNRVYVEFTAQSATEVLRFHSLTGSGNPNLLAGGGAAGYGVVVDDVRITTKYCDDFSDAPVSYGTASHTATGPQLGTVRDNEPVATPNPDATGDDAAGSDDEDSLQSLAVYTGATTASAVVTALNLTASPATLAAWVDFNGNGVFDAGERTETTVPATTNALTPFTLTWSALTPVPLPTGATTFARFRIGVTAAELASPTGGATSGEVEDYAAAATALANLSLVKVALTNPVLAAEPIVYELTVSNAGPSPATTVAVNDSLPTGTTFISAAGAGWTCALNGGAVGCTTPSLGVGQTSIITVTVRAPNEASSVANTATVGSPVPDPDPGDNTSSTTTTVTAQADLTITKVSSPNPYVPGDALSYNLIVSNLGPSTVTGATVSDPLPAVVTPDNWNWSCTPNTGGAACATPSATGVTAVNTAVTLPPGGSVTILVTGTVVSSATGVLTNTATVTEPAGVSDPTPGNNQWTDVNNASITADLRVSKTATPSPFVPGEALTYTIVASNAGPSDIQGARVQDTFPAAFAGFAWACAPSTGAACPTASGTGNIDVLVDLPAGGSVTFTSTGTVPSGYVSSANNAVTIMPPPNTKDPVPGNNTTTYENPPNVIADLAITKTQTPEPYVPGTAITYMLLVQNLGPSDAVNARVQDVLTGVITGATWTCAAAGTGASCATASGVNVVDTLVTLPVGTTATFTVTGTVLPSATGIVSNTAVVMEPVGATDPVPGNNESTVNSGGAPLADLVIVKTAPSESYTPGAPLTFTIVASNSGPSDAPNAHVQDLFPPALSGFTWTCAPSSGAATCSVASGLSMIDTYVDLPVGGAVTFTVTGTVAADTTGAVTNTATIVPPVGVNDPNHANNLSAVTLGANALADLSLTKTSSPNPYVPGTPITYTIVATNSGPSVLFGGRVRDGLPAVLENVTWTCGASGGTCPAPSGTGHIDALIDIDPGGTVTFTIVADVPGGTRGTLVNAATIVPPPGTEDPAPTNNSGVDYNPSIPIPGPADLQITQEFPGVAPPNGLLTFRLRSRNLGSNTALNPYMTGMIPPGTTFVSVTPSAGGMCNTPGNPPPPDRVTGYPVPGAATEPLRCTWPGLMKPGESHFMEFTVRLAPGTPTGQILWSCFWTWSETDDPYHANNVVDAYLFVDDGASPVGDLAIQAGALSEGVVGTTLPTRVGVPVPMRFWATNNGPATTRGQYALILDTANTIEIVDVKLPQGWVSPSGPSSAVWDTGPVAPGQTVALDLTVRVLTPGTMELFAQRIAGSPGDPNASNERATIVLDGYGPGAAGRWVAVGNVDGAGAGEILTGAGQGETPQVRVFTGTGADTGLRFFAYERPFPGGVQIASCDVNGDGIAELITAPGPGRAPTIRVLSLVGGVVTELIAFDAFESGFTGGASVACADLDADGAAEVIIGAGPGRAPEVQVYNVGLSSIVPRATFLAYEAGFLGGVRVAAGVYPGRAGWLDAFAIATTPGAGRAPELRLWTETGAPVAQVVVSSATRGVLPTLGDVNGDGQLDLLLAPDDGRPELVRIFNVDTGELLGDVPGALPAFPVGIRTAIGVLDGGPGQPEIVIGNGPGGHPRVRVIYWPPSGPTQRLEILPLEIP